MSVLEIIKELQSINGVGSMTKKKAILTENKDNSNLSDFFYYSCDPRINYWQEKITEIDGNRLDNDINVGDKHHLFGSGGVMEIIMEHLVSRTVSGNAAIKLLGQLYASLDKDEQTLLKMIITRKPGVGMAAKSINSIWPRMIYDCAYMRCKGYSPKNVELWDWNWVISQIKADGMFLNFIDGPDGFEIRTRVGEKIKNIIVVCPDEIVALKKISDELNITEPVFHGEAVVWYDGKPIDRSKSNGLINSLKAGEPLPKDHYIMFSIWDVIPHENFDTHMEYDVDYKVRFLELEKAINKVVTDEHIEIIEYKMVKNQREVAEHFVEVLQRGLEGTVVKCADGKWKVHDSPSQLKVKNKFEIEMEIFGFKEGNGKFASTFGSLEIVSSDGKVVSSISGINDSVRKLLNENREYFKGTIVTVRVNGVFKNEDGTYGLMHPRFVENRTDKSKADSLEKILQQEQDCIYGTSLAKDMK